MNGAFHVAGIGLETQQTALDMLANNIANLNTDGFKRSDVQFSELVSISRAELEATANRGALSGVSVQGRIAMSDQGPLEQTGGQMDLALDGLGFIELLGPNGQTMLWRGGRLQVNQDGFLAGEQGLMLAAQINVPTDATSLQIDREGVVTATFSDGELSELGRIDLVRVASEAGMQRQGGGIYQMMDGSPASHSEAGVDGMGQFVQGSLERSNVDLNREMVQMMIVQRAYAANAQLVQAADQMVSIANNLRR